MLATDHLPECSWPGGRAAWSPGIALLPPGGMVSKEPSEARVGVQMPGRAADVTLGPGRAAPVSTADLPSSPSFRFVLCRPHGARHRPVQSAGTLVRQVHVSCDLAAALQLPEPELLFLTIKWGRAVVDMEGGMSGAGSSAWDAVGNN